VADEGPLIGSRSRSVFFGLNKEGMILVFQSHGSLPYHLQREALWLREEAQRCGLPYASLLLNAGSQI